MSTTDLKRCVANLDPLHDTDEDSSEEYKFGAFNHVFSLFLLGAMKKNHFSSSREAYVAMKRNDPIQVAFTQESVLKSAITADPHQLACFLGANFDVFFHFDDSDYHAYVALHRSHNTTFADSYYAFVLTNLVAQNGILSYPPMELVLKFDNKGNRDAPIYSAGLHPPAASGVMLPTDGDKSETFEEMFNNMVTRLDHVDSDVKNFYTSEYIRSPNIGLVFKPQYSSSG
jgi:hypothetical protein